MSLLLIIAKLSKLSIRLSSSIPESLFGSLLDTFPNSVALTDEGASLRSTYMCLALALSAKAFASLPSPTLLSHLQFTISILYFLVDVYLNFLILGSVPSLFVIVGSLPSFLWSQDLYLHVFDFRILTFFSFLILGSILFFILRSIPSFSLF